MGVGDGLAAPPPQARMPMQHLPTVGQGGTIGGGGPNDVGAGAGYMGNLVLPYGAGMPSLTQDMVGGGTVAGTSQTRRLDELDIAMRLSEHYRDAR